MPVRAGKTRTTRGCEGFIADDDKRDALALPGVRSDLPLGLLTGTVSNDVCVTSGGGVIADLAGHALIAPTPVLPGRGVGPVLGLLEAAARS